MSLVVADVRVGYPMTEPWDGTEPAKASHLLVEPCAVIHARELNTLWHSRLPQTRRGPWMYAFTARWHGRTYGVALWCNPSARMLPAQWVELQRLAVAPDAPHCAASRMLGQMAKWFKANHPEHERLISYQDCEVHIGTIYKAAGWGIGHYQKPTVRDRSTTRPGGLLYRWSINGEAPDVSGKNRWELPL